MLLYQTFIFLCITVTPTPTHHIGKVLRIAQGQIKGKYAPVRGNKVIVEYLGIPYAIAGRFEYPKPAHKWAGIRDAYKKPLPCLQYNAGEIIGEEDCLKINVYTPQTHERYNLRGLPVVVVIHGSHVDFEDGAGHYFGSKYFSEFDIVFVTFNYRLGVFGFLSSGDSTIPANLGLKDQRMALKWVNRNIEFFGGSPDWVTILGQGSGAASVHLQTLSEKSRGLFRRAIMQSGSALCPWTFQHDPADIYEEFEKRVGCKEFTGETLTCLKGLEATVLLDRKITKGLRFRPVIEFWSNDSKMFINDFPINIINNLTTSNLSVPILLGANEQNGITIEWAAHVLNQFHPRSLIWNSTQPSNFHRYFNYRPKDEEISYRISYYYFFSNSTDELIAAFFDALKHRNYLQCARDTAIANSKRWATFLYYFTKKSKQSLLDLWKNRWGEEFSILKHKKTTLLPPVHGDELQYLFDLTEYGDFDLIRKENLKFSRTLVKMWLNFTVRGKPSSSWLPVNPARLKWEVIGDGKVDFIEDLKFWDELDLDKPIGPTRPTENVQNATGEIDNRTKTDSSETDKKLDRLEVIYVDVGGENNGDGNEKLFKDNDDPQDEL